MGRMKPDILEGLNSIQKEAVTHTRGPLLVLAGAGSGKTRLLTSKIAYLIRELHEDPFSILAITFTNKAAAEMKSRVEALLGINLAVNMWVSTFHSVCNRFLRRHAGSLEFDTNFAIYDAGDSLQVIKECMKELTIDPKAHPPKGILSRISAAKNKLTGPDQYRAEAVTPLAKLTAVVYSRYERKLKAANAMDFDDLIINTIRLFRHHPDVLEKYRRQFNYVLVDEYQDTNPMQYQLIKLLAGEEANLTVVGDEDQSIYAFRMADIRNILDFERDFPGATVIKMEQNYRSTDKILEASNRLISNNVSRKGKTLWTANKEGALVNCYGAVDEGDEAHFVTKEIGRLIDEGYSYRDFAVFYRTHAQSRVVEEVFLRANYPYRIFGGLRFYERKEVKDTLAYLKVLDNPGDTVSLKRIVNVPKRGLGDKTIEKITELAEAKQISVFEAMLRVEETDLATRLKALTGDFVDMVKELRNLRETSTLSQLIRAVWRKSGYTAELEAERSAQAESRLENLTELLSVAAEYETGGNAVGDLSEFLQRTALLVGTEMTEGGEGGVSLMTLHSAKGLEFPVVFVVGLEEGLFPHVRSIGSETEIEEERRLCYVGMTRAEKRLYLVYAWSRTMFGQHGASRPSRFLEEIPQELLEHSGSERPADRFGGRRYDPAEDAGGGYGRPARAKGGQMREIFPGETVRHAKWGDGIVVDIEGTGENAVATISFEDIGTKRVLLSYTPLELKHEG